MSETIILKIGSKVSILLFSSRSSMCFSSPVSYFKSDVDLKGDFWVDWDLDWK